MSVFQLLLSLDVLSTFKSKSNLNCLLTVPLLLLIVPVILSSFSKSPTVLKTFKLSDIGSQPFLATIPETFLPSTLTISPSKNLVSLNIGENAAKSLFLMTLPKLLSI